MLDAFSNCVNVTMPSKVTRETVTRLHYDGSVVDQ